MNYFQQSNTRSAPMLVRELQAQCMLLATCPSAPRKSKLRSGNWSAVSWHVAINSSDTQRSLHCITFLCLVPSYHDGKSKSTECHSSLCLEDKLKISIMLRPINCLVRFEDYRVAINHRKMLNEGNVKINIIFFE